MTLLILRNVQRGLSTHCPVTGAVSLLYVPHVITEYSHLTHPVILNQITYITHHGTGDVW